MEAAELEQLGAVSYMDPFTAMDIRDRMRRAQVPDASLNLVKQMWEAYQDAILEKKLPPFLKDTVWLPTFNDMLVTTQAPKITVSAFLTSLRAHAYEKNTMQYLDPAQGAKAQAKTTEAIKNIIAMPGKIVQTASKPIIDTAASAGIAVTRPLMWVAIGAAAIAAIYVTMQVAPMLKAKKRVTRKRKS